MHERTLRRWTAPAAVALAAATLSLSAAARTSETPASAQIALDWNAAAVDAVRAAKIVEPAGTPPRPLYQTEGLLYLSYVQAAVYDAVAKITRRYEPYHRFRADARAASPEAAVAAAAYDTLVFYLGDPTGALAARYAATVAALPADGATERGLAVGKAAAEDIEALRANDGRNAPVKTSFGTPPAEPGVWVFAPPPSLQTPQTPWLASVRPFLLASPDQFRAPPPPALSSSQYAADLNETEAYGSATSTVRSPGQTAIAWFWNANNVNQVNQTLRGVAAQHGLDLTDTVRLLAMGDVVTTDAGIACFDSKYAYRSWRPLTAIRDADVDGNAATTADPGWSPLGTTPNHPEYPSQHGCLISSLGEVLATVLGTDAIDAAVPGAQGGATTLSTSQTFHTVRDLDAQLVDARVWIGFHFRGSVLAAENLGTAAAGWALRRDFLPVCERDDVLPRCDRHGDD